MCMYRSVGYSMAVPGFIFGEVARGEKIWGRYCAITEKFVEISSLFWGGRASGVQPTNPLLFELPWLPDGFAPVSIATLIMMFIARAFCPRLQSWSLQIKRDLFQINELPRCARIKAVAHFSFSTTVYNISNFGLCEQRMWTGHALCGLLN